VSVDGMALNCHRKVTVDSAAAFSMYNAPLHISCRCLLFRIFSRPLRAMNSVCDVSPTHFVMSGVLEQS